MVRPREKAVGADEVGREGKVAGKRVERANKRGLAQFIQTNATSLFFSPVSFIQLSESRLHKLYTRTYTETTDSGYSKEEGKDADHFFLSFGQTEGKKGPILITIYAYAPTLLHSSSHASFRTNESWSYWTFRHW